jgi:hypothetical protein
MKDCKCKCVVDLPDIVDGRECFCGYLCDPEEASQSYGNNTKLPPGNFECPDHGLFEYCCNELCVLKNVSDERCCDCPIGHDYCDDSPLGIYCSCDTSECINSREKSKCEHCRNNQMYWDESDGRSDHTDLTNLRITHVTNDTCFADGCIVKHGLESGSMPNESALSTGPDGGMYFSVVCLVCKKEYEITDK